MDGTTKKLTNFSDRQMGVFRITPDGSAVVFVRFVITRDAVQMTGFR